MCVCWVSVDCEEPEVRTEEASTEAPHDYKAEGEVNYQNAVSIHLQVYMMHQSHKLIFLVLSYDTLVKPK